MEISTRCNAACPECPRNFRGVDTIDSYPVCDMSLEQAQKIYDQSVIQLKEGVANLTELLLADNALREAQNNYLTSIIDYMKADLELKKIKGNISTKK